MSETTAAADDHVVTGSGTPETDLVGVPQAAAVPLGPRTIDEALALALSAINDVSIVADNILAGLFLRMRREVADAHDRGYDEGYQDAIERAATRLSEHPAARRAVLDLAGRTDS